MQQRFFSGKWVCEELGISLDELAARCHRGELTAYRDEGGQPILASSQCKGRFTFPENNIFRLLAPKTRSILAISKKCTENFILYIDKQLIMRKRKHKMNDNKNYFISAAMNASYLATKKKIEGIREINIEYHGEIYSIYYNITNINSIFNHTHKSHFELKTPKEPFVIKSYSYNDIFFEVAKEGQLNLDFLTIEADPQISNIKSHNVNVKVKSISDGINEKLIIDDYDENKIDLEIGMCICNPCDVLYISEKMCSKDFTKKRRLCRISKENYAQDYFVESNGEKHFLQFGTDFFIFDFKEFYKQMYGSIDKNVSKSEFHKYIKEFFYDYKVVSKLCWYEIELTKISSNPIQYILDKCSAILLKEQDKENILIIQAYCEAISNKKIKWIEQCKKYWPKKYKEIENKNQYINGRHGRFKGIAKENGIPYIKVKILREMTDQTRPQVIEEMRRQLETMWHKDNF